MHENASQASRATALRAPIAPPRERLYEHTSQHILEIYRHCRISSLLVRVLVYFYLFFEKILNNSYYSYRSDSRHQVIFTYIHYEAHDLVCSTVLKQKRIYYVLLLLIIIRIPPPLCRIHIDSTNGMCSGDIIYRGALYLICNNYYCLYTCGTWVYEKL